MLEMMELVKRKTVLPFDWCPKCEELEMGLFSYDGDDNSIMRTCVKHDICKAHDEARKNYNELNEDNES